MRPVESPISLAPLHPGFDLGGFEAVLPGEPIVGKSGVIDKIEIFLRKTVDFMV